jgi:hypothetical protein
MHAAPGSQSRGFTADYTTGEDLWGDPEYEARTVALWQAIAARYASDETVAGYDLLNEPYLAFQNDRVIALYKRIIQAIRQVDRNHLIIVEGNMLAHDFKGFGRWDENMAWSFHQYSFDLDLDPKRTVDGYVRAAQAADVPLWNGEFGEGSYEDVAKQVAMYERAPLAGTAFWSWKKGHRNRIFGYPGDARPGPVLFKVTDAWFKVIDWMGNPGLAAKPTAAEAEQGLQELITEIRHDRVTPDPKMIDILDGSGA